MRIGWTKKCNTLYNNIFKFKKKKKKRKKRVGHFIHGYFFTSGNQINRHVLVIYKCNIDKHRGREGEVRVLMNTLNSSFIYVSNT